MLQLLFTSLPADLWTKQLELGLGSEMQNWGAPAFGKGKAQPVDGKANPVPARPASPYGDRGNADDWDSPQWGSQQFAPMAAMMAMMMAGGFTGGKGNQVKGDPKFLVYVANIDWKAPQLQLVLPRLDLPSLSEDELSAELPRPRGRS